MNLLIILSFENIEMISRKFWKKDKVKIATETKVIMPTDKSFNFYKKVDKDDYKDLLDKEIQKKYKKASEDDERNIKAEHSNIVTNLEIDDRVFTTTKNSARITLKDHKPVCDSLDQVGYFFCPCRCFNCIYFSLY